MKSFKTTLRKLSLALSLGLSSCIDWDNLGIQPDASLNRDSSITSDGESNNKLDARIINNDASLGICYRNDFTESTSLNGLIIENGLWSRHPDGFLRQIEEYESSWRKVYFNNEIFNNLEAKVKIRMIDSTNSSAGVDSNHTGILLRYNPETRSGYVIQLQRSNMDTVQINLSEINTGDNIKTETIDCGEIGCGYNKWYDFKVRIVGSDIGIYLDGIEILTTTDSRYTTGKIGFACYASGESHYDDLEVCEIE